MALGSLILLLSSDRLTAQTFPQDFDYSRYNEVLIDAGIGWKQNSMFHPLRVPGEQDSSVEIGAFRWVDAEMKLYGDAINAIASGGKDGLAGIGIVGIETRKHEGVGAEYDGLSITTNVWAQLRFRENWYTRSAVRATNEAKSLYHYSGFTRGVSRAGINASEVDQGVVGYENDWSTVEFGRTREIWGPMGEENLVPGGRAPAWEEFKLEGRYKRLTYRYFFGFLEVVEIPSSGDIIQRYVMGRALEYRNGRNMVVGVSELAMISGKDRPVDWAFLNPLSIEVEVEQNHRGNSEANSSKANAVWVTHVDWLATPSLRVAGSFLIDEFQFDQQDRDSGRTDLTGYLLHVAWTPKRSPIGITTFMDWVRIGTYTMMHSDSSTVFSSRGQFMGNSIGNDAEKLELGVRTVFNFPLMIEGAIGMRRWGEMSLLENPYGTYEKILEQSFPSGQSSLNRYLRLRVDYRPLEQVALGLNGHFDLSHSGPNSAMNAVLFEARFQIKPFTKSF